MTVRYFRHDDVGAPTLTGQVGSLNTLLRKCLVGVGGVAYGSKPSAGWTEEFAGTGTNLAAFRNASAAGASGCFVRVNDNATGSARDARVVVYAAMTDVNTGTFPTTEIFIHKSSSLDSVPRKWLLAADGATLCLYAWDTGEADGGYRDSSFYSVGDYACFDSGNAFRYMALGRHLENPGSNANHSGWMAGVTTYVGSGGFSLPSQSGIGGPFSAGIVSCGTDSNKPIGAGVQPAGPDPVSGDFHFAVGPFIASNGRIVGRLRGVGRPLVNISAQARGVPLAGSGNWVVMLQGIGTVSGGYIGGIVLDTVGAW